MHDGSRLIFAARHLDAPRSGSIDRSEVGKPQARRKCCLRRDPDHRSGVSGTSGGFRSAALPFNSRFTIGGRLAISQIARPWSEPLACEHWFGFAPWGWSAASAMSATGSPVYGDMVSLSMRPLRSVETDEGATAIVTTGMRPAPCLWPGN